MGETIVDPETNRGWKIDDEGRGVIRADMVTHLQHHSMTHKNLFLVGFCTVLQTVNEEFLGIFKNIDTEVDFEFYITQINSPQDVDIIPYFDAEYSSGGEIVTAKNMNRGSGLPLPETRAFIRRGGDDGDLILTGGSDWGVEFNLKARESRDINFQGGLILTNGKSIAFGVKGPIDTKVCMLTLCSYHVAGTEL